MDRGVSSSGIYRMKCVVLKANAIQLQSGCDHVHFYCRVSLMRQAESRIRWIIFEHSAVLPSQPSCKSRVSTSHFLSEKSSPKLTRLASGLCTTRQSGYIFNLSSVLSWPLYSVRLRMMDLSYLFSNSTASKGAIYFLLHKMLSADFASPDTPTSSNSWTPLRQMVLCTL